MTITADSLTAWLLTYHDGPVGFVRRAWADEAQIPAEVRELRLERVRPLLAADKGALGPPTRPVIIETAEYGFERWQEVFFGKDPNWKDLDHDGYTAAFHDIPATAFLFFGLDAQDDQVRAGLFIDNMNVMLSNQYLTVRQQVPSVVGESMVGKPVSEMCDHEVFKGQAIEIAGFDPPPMQKFIVNRRDFVSLD